MNFLQDIPYLYRFALWQTIVWGSGYLVARSQNLKPGWQRAVVGIPLVILNFLLPQLFHGARDIFLAIISFMSTAGVTNSKLLAWVLNRGPLTTPGLTPGQRAAIYALVLNPANESKLFCLTYYTMNLILY